MAEFGEDGSLPPLNRGDTTVAGDEAAGKTHCEVSLLNGNCGISEDMVGSGSLIAPGCQAEVETANTSVGLDGKSEIPRRSSIIKVNVQCLHQVIHSGGRACTSTQNMLEVATQNSLKFKCNSFACLVKCMVSSPQAHNMLFLNIS